VNNINIIKQLDAILKSDAKNYFESSERLSLMNILYKLKNDSYESSTSDSIFINEIIKKYGKFVT